jgi:ribonuclease HII
MYIDNSHPMFDYENEAWGAGFENIAGIDEVGRGPLAGPVVAAAVVIPKGIDFPAVNDSKKLTERQRNKLNGLILEFPGIQYAITEIQPEAIDRLNILRAAQLAMKEAVLKIVKVDFAIIDGLPVPQFPVKNKSLVKGDSKSASIAAASIIAKVYRDKIMEKYAIEFPEYGFEKNKGYGTAQHLKALKKYGPTPIHRKSFAPVKYFFEKKEFEQPEFEL